jgi:hypothetical protein
MVEEVSVLRRFVSKDMLLKSPDEKWNQFIDLIATEKYDVMNDIQKTAYLCFWYDSEVLNGGHLQYFVNRGLSLIDETVCSLKSIGAVKQSILLANAKLIVFNKGISKIISLEDYVTEAMEKKFDEIDIAYYQCSPSTSDLIEQYFLQNENEFIILEC